MTLAMMGAAVSVGWAGDDATTATLVPAAVDLANIPWETNMDDAPWGAAEAKRGGTLRVALPSYPATFRLVGPNSNDMFAGWNRSFSIDFGLVGMHPNTDQWFPMLATHWYVAPDNKTVYYKLDPRARWSDGKPVTADDYVFTNEMLRSPHIVDPYYKQYMEMYIANVEKLDTHTIRITGVNESWRPLAEITLPPYPRHAIKLDANWVTDQNYTPPVVVGPYVISEWKTNESVTFKRLANWWGDDHHYMKGLYNPDTLVVRIIEDSDRMFDFFRRRELDYLEINMARMWETQMDFDGTQKGWVRARRVFVESPEGMSGLGMNLSTPLLGNKDFRKALHHLFNFQTINEELMFNAYYQKVSAFHGTEYANPELKAYPFDPRKAREHLQKAGFSKRGNDGILVNDAGERASITLLYGSKGVEPHLGVIQNLYKRGGVELKLQLLEGGTFFNRIRENASELFYFGMTGGYYPSPWQYFATEFKDIPQSNNFWNFGTEKTDALIKTYMFDMDADKRLAALHELDAIIQEEAFYIPFWFGPYIRFLHYDYVKFPASYYPRRASTISDAMTLWIDTDQVPVVEQAIRDGRDLGGQKGRVDVDPYGIKARLEATK